MSRAAAKKGRPPFKVTPAHRRRVSVGAAAGMTHDELANALGISRPTLEKHFEVELGAEKSRRRLDALDSMYRASQRGNVAASKAFVAICDKAEAGVITPRPAFVKPAEPKPEKKGKKQIQQEEAVTASQGTDWHDLLTPARAQ